MKNILSGIVAVILSVSTINFASAQNNPPTSEIEGAIVKIVPSEREIYVESGGKKHEYYFKDNTKVVQGDAEKTFEDLKKGMRVKVSAHKFGKRLDPLEVRILE